MFSIDDESVIRRALRRHHNALAHELKVVIYDPVEKDHPLAVSLRAEWRQTDELIATLDEDGRARS